MRRLDLLAKRTKQAPPEWWSSDEWATPPELVRWVAAGLQIPQFDLDACCRAESAKAPSFFTRQEDGLTQSWHGNVWVNPPYSSPKPWIEKAIQEVQSGRAVLVALLLPSRTDTGWFHDLILPHAGIMWLRGRPHFIGWQGTPIPSPRDPAFVAYMKAGLA